LIAASTGGKKFQESYDAPCGRQTHRGRSPRDMPPSLVVACRGTSEIRLAIFQA
jgi:hypothetical protein